MQRLSLAAVDNDDLIQIILAHPMAGRFVAEILANSEGAAALVSYQLVLEEGTVCLRMPGLTGCDKASAYLLVWQGEARHPWRIEARTLPRDSNELRLVTLAATTGRSMPVAFTPQPHLRQVA